VALTERLSVPCTNCKLRMKPLFRPFSTNEIDFVAAMKSDHVNLPPKAAIIGEGEVGGPVYTLFEGWAARYRRLPDGSRQIFDILLAGDMIGLESVALGTVKHSVEAITPVALCVLDGRPLSELFREQPALALSIFRTRIEEEQRADVRLALLGRRPAFSRVAYLLLETCDRLRQRGMVNGGSTYHFPLTRRHIADATGLSQMHLTRVLNDMRDKRLALIDRAALVVYDWERLAELAEYVPVGAVGRRAIL
jgi:CRP/FNR family transcriptional regulator, anaerobic regulatory protein